MTRFNTVLSTVQGLIDTPTYSGAGSLRCPSCSHQLLIQVTATIKSESHVKHRATASWNVQTISK